MVGWDISKVQKNPRKDRTRDLDFLLSPSPRATHQEDDQLLSGSSNFTLFDIHPVYYALLPLP